MEKQICSQRGPLKRKAGWNSRTLGAAENCSFQLPNAGAGHRGTAGLVGCMERPRSARGAALAADFSMHLELPRLLPRLLFMFCGPVFGPWDLGNTLEWISSCALAASVRIQSGNARARADQAVCLCLCCCLEETTTLLIGLSRGETLGRQSLLCISPDRRAYGGPKLLRL